MTMRVFIAGIMQGSRQDEQIDNQGYRLRIAEALRDHLPAVEIVDPWSTHPRSVTYDDDQARRTFLEQTTLVRQVDVVLAFLPQASMGTAIELWTAHAAGIPTVVVTPLVHNWVVRITASHVLPDLDSLLSFIASGRLAHLVDGQLPAD